MLSAYLKDDGENGPPCVPEAIMPVAGVTCSAGGLTVSVSCPALSALAGIRVREIDSGRAVGARGKAVRASARIICRHRPDA
jgi:hypothetical protein